jgi:hypothetical protein
LFAAAEQAKLRGAVRLGLFFDLPHAQMALNSIGLNWPHGKSNTEHQSIVGGVETLKPEMRNHNDRYFLGELHIFSVVVLVFNQLSCYSRLRIVTLASHKVNLEKISSYALRE